MFGPVRRRTQAALIAGSATTAAALAKRRAQQRQLLPAEPQTEPPVLPQVVQGGPLAGGLRVVEMASILAAPLVGRTLADWGAEVIKVEPPEGDLLRGNLADEQKHGPRVVPATFEYVNLGKAGVQLDIRTAAGRRNLFQILGGADVFITNVRIDALAKAGLRYQDIADRFPRLVYAHLTGWGSEGEDSSRAGLDAGCFWAATGIAASVNGEVAAGCYPQGFGDCVTGYGLLAGVLLALIDRDRRTGRGQLVDCSLFRAGLWCVSPGIIGTVDMGMAQDAGETSSITDYRRKPPMRGWTGGQSSDVAWWSGPFRCCGVAQAEFVWLDPTDDSTAAESELRLATVRAVQLPGIRAEVFLTLNDAALLALPGVEFRDLVQEAFCQHSTATILEALQLEGVTCAVRHVSFEEAGSAVFAAAKIDDTHRECNELAALFRTAGCIDNLCSRLGITDMPGMARLPIELVELSEQHGPRSRGPRKGEHTFAVLKRCPAHQQLQGAQISTIAAAGTSAGTLQGIKVLELSSSLDLSASATCCQLVEHGATVIKFKTFDGDSRSLGMSDQYDRGKKHVFLDGLSDLRLLELISTLDVLVTNVQTERLRLHGVAPELLRSRFPSLIVVLLSPWGVNGDKVSAAAAAAGLGPACGALGAMWSASGLSGAMQSVVGAPPPTPTLHLPELMASVFGFAGVAAGLFERRRAGRGQLVDISYLRVGLLLSACRHSSSRYHVNRSLAFAWAPSEEEYNLQSWPFVFKTGDGQYFMLYDMRPSHVFGAGQAAGISRHSLVLPLLAGAWGALMDENRKKGATGLVALRRFFRPYALALQRGFEKLLWSEVSKQLCSLNVWHCRVAMPYQMVDYRAACLGHAAATFLQPRDNDADDKELLQVLVRGPVFLSSCWPNSASTPPKSRL